MTGAGQCSVAGCDRPAAASLEGEVLCREHFISVCYARLGRYEELRKGAGLGITDSEAVRRFINECTRQADLLEHAAQGLDDLERSKLLNIILAASELGRHLRRSPRKAAAIAVRLSCDKPGAAWEEDTETLLVSRYGALVRCSHPTRPGETLEMMRSDTGRKVQARVAWQRPYGLGKDGARLGVEFIACENFWELDWGAVEEAS